MPLPPLTAKQKIWRLLALPFLLTVGSLFGSCAGVFLPRQLCLAFGWLFLLGLLFFLVSAIFWFVRKNWRFGLGAMGCLALSVLAMAIAFVTELGAGDPFTHNLKLPVGIELSEPDSGSAGPIRGRGKQSLGERLSILLRKVRYEHQ